MFESQGGSREIADCLFSCAIAPLINLPINSFIYITTDSVLSRHNMMCGALQQQVGEVVLTEAGERESRGWSPTRSEPPADILHVIAQSIPPSQL